MQGLLPYVVRRLAWAPVILLAVSFITFAIIRLGPGDPVSVAQGQYRDPEVLERIRHTKGLDKPFLEQYGIYLKNVLHGDLGESFRYPTMTVPEIIFRKMWVSAQIGIVALAVIFGVGIPIGIYAAVKQGTWADPFSISVFLFFQSIPVLVTVPVMLLVFVLKLHWLPTGGWACPVDLGFLPEPVNCIGVFDKRIIMPVLALSLPGVAGVARLTRATTLSVLGEEYVRTARAKGLREFTVMSRHVARNALLPLVTVIGLSLAALLEGAFFTETLLGIPGIGRLAFESVGERDYDVIMAMTMVLATAFIVANIVIDIVYTFIDPRIRYERQRAG
ncbi:MAG: ABC transporter permease [Dehalococcoidia bacterium]|nr:ABC transporter permease [Dehalococcoidia bacterium]